MKAGPLSPSLFHWLPDQNKPSFFTHDHCRMKCNKGKTGRDEFGVGGGQVSI